MTRPNSERMVSGHARHLTLILLFPFLACSKPSPPAPTTVTATNSTVTGTVVERLDGPPYSCLRLATDKGEVWAAVPMESVSKGKQVTVKHGAELKSFQAPRLGFDLVVFVDPVPDPVPRTRTRCRRTRCRTSRNTSHDKML